MRSKREDKIVNLVKKNGRVKIVVLDKDGDLYKVRVLRESGCCKYRFVQCSSPKFRRSCFTYKDGQGPDVIRIKDPVRRTVRAMLSYDAGYGLKYTFYVGKNLNKAVK